MQLGHTRTSALSLDVHRMTSDGFETFNDIKRNAGEIKVLYNLSKNTTITGYSGVDSPLQQRFQQRLLPIAPR